MRLRTCTAVQQKRNMGQFRCPLCKEEFITATYQLILVHLRHVHKDDPGFLVTCGIGGCTRTYRKFASLYSHTYRSHPELIKSKSELKVAVSSFTNAGISIDPEDEPQDFPTNEPVDESPEIQRILGTDLPTQKKSSALFILKLKEKQRLTQVAVDNVVEGCSALFDQCVTRLQAGVYDKLHKAGVNPSTIEGLQETFDQLPDPFVGLKTEHYQEKHFRDELGLIEPEEISVGAPYYVQQFSGSKRRLVEVRDKFQYVSLIKSLSQLMKDPTIREQVEHSSDRISRNTQRMEDFCDGHVFKHHPVFSNDPRAIQLIAYYDEIELCNPLGAYVKTHKLGLVFFSIGNIHPKFRSALWAMNVVVAATQPVIEKHGIDNILHPFIKDLQTLDDEGLRIEVDGTEYHFQVALLAFLADTLASHQLGGFKLSMSWAFRNCRTCMCTNESGKVKFNSKLFQMRTLEQHNDHCDLIEGPTGAHYSTTYGINRRSCLLEIPHFNMLAFGLPHDIMHDLLEGVVQYELKCLLNYCCARGFFTLEVYNERLQTFDYGYSETGNKPLPITSRNLKSNDKKLRLNASQTRLLARVTPLLVGKLVPEDLPQWQCFLLLMKIVDICLCNRVSTSISGVLKTAIEEHHKTFVDLYPDYSVIPKMHYMVHYPEQIIALGPLIRAWTMRYEAKLSFFKKASHLGNFRNIASSLVKRHQRLMCYELASGQLLTRPIECGPSAPPNKLSDESKSIQEGVSSVFCDVSLNVTVSHPAWAKHNGIVYSRNNCYLLIGVEGINPKFGRVIDILIVGSYFFFILTLCKVHFFDEHIRAYSVSLTAQQILVPYEKITDPIVLHSYKCFGQSDDTYIVLKHFFSDLYM